MSKSKLVLCVVFIVFIVCAIYSINYFTLYNPDSARYVAWANSLADFNGYLDNTSPEAQRYVIHSPLYPLTLAPVAFFFSYNIIALKTVNVILSACIMVVVFLLLKNGGNKAVSVFIVAFFAAHPFVLIYSTQILSEILFGLGFVLILYGLSTSKNNQDSRVNFYIVLCSMLICIFSRDIGILTIPIVLFYYLFRKQNTKAILIFFIPLILYGVWYIRNEVYYANVEQTELRNSVLFFSNTLTSPDAGFIEELQLRIAKNLTYYSREMTVLIFSPAYHNFEKSFGIPWMSFVDARLPVMQLMQSVVRNGYILISASTFLLVTAGLIIDYRNNKIFYLKAAFLLLYFSVIIIYPVLDVRFLFPVLILFLLWIGSALQYIIATQNRWIKASVVTFIVMLCIPNLLWSVQFVRIQHNLYEDPSGKFFDTGNSDSSHVGVFRTPLPEISEWLNEQHDSSLVILSPYKELSFSLGNKKVFVLKGLAPVGLFNQIIRDYEIRYIVLKKDSFEWRDYEYQMGMNDRYSFKLVFEKGFGEVYQIFPKSAGYKNVSRYATVLQQVKDGDYSSADEFFIRNKSFVSVHPDLTYLQILNKHFEGELDSVSLLIQRLYTMPQGLLYAHSASMHQVVINRRAQFNAMSHDYDKAQLSMTLAINYWEIDMNKIAVKYSTKCVELDSSFALGYAHNIVFALQMSDTARAFLTFNKFKRNFPGAELTQKIDTLMQLVSEFRKNNRGASKSIVLEKLFDLYLSLGSTDLAIENIKSAIVFDPSRSILYIKLADVFEKQRKYFAALIVIKKYIQLSGNSAMVDAQLHRIRNKLYL